MVSNAIEVNLGTIDALDPDENYFEQINDSNHSKYFTAHEFSSEFCVSPKKLVILNINIRSFFKNVDNTIAFLQSLACGLVSICRYETTCVCSYGIGEP